MLREIPAADNFNSPWSGAKPVKESREKFRM